MQSYRYYYTAMYKYNALNESKTDPFLKNILLTYHLLKNKLLCFHFSLEEAKDLLIKQLVHCTETVMKIGPSEWDADDSYSTMALMQNWDTQV